MESETGIGRRGTGGVDADEEVVGARGGDRVQRVPGHQWWVVRILNFDGEVFCLWKQISLVLGIPPEVGGAIVSHGSSVH